MHFEMRDYLNMSSVFLDTNFFLDIFDASRQRHPKAKEVLEKLLQNNTALYTSCDIIATISYFLQKQLSLYDSVTTLDYIVNRVTVLSANNQDLIELTKNILELLQQDATLKLDYEDCMQLFLAHKYGIEQILTSDKSFCPKVVERYSVRIVELDNFLNL